MSRAGPNDDVYPTPDRIFRPLDSLLRFDLDVAANRHNAKCRRYYTERDNGLIQPWNGRSVFVNPPYGRKDYPTGSWVAKARETVKEFDNRVTLMIPVKADTTWYHDGIWGRNRVRDSAILLGPIPGRWYQLDEGRGLYVELLELRGRVSFRGEDETGWFASAVVLFNAGRRPVLPALQTFARSCA